MKCLLSAVGKASAHHSWWRWFLCERDYVCVASRVEGVSCGAFDWTSVETKWYIFCQKQTRSCVHRREAGLLCFTGCRTCVGPSVSTWRASVRSFIRFYHDPLATTQTRAAWRRISRFRNVKNWYVSSWHRWDTASNPVAKHIFTQQAGSTNKAQQCMTTIGVSLCFF